MQQQITKLETNLTIEQNESNLHFDTLEAEIKLWKQRFETLKDSVYDLGVQQFSFKKEIVSTASSITDVHKDCLLKINERDDHNNKQIHACDQKINEISKESNRSMKISNSNATNINKIDNLIREMAETFDTTRHDVNTLFSKKVENESYDKSISEINQRFRNIEFTMKTNLNSQISTDE